MSDKNSKSDKKEDPNELSLCNKVSFGNKSKNPVDNSMNQVQIQTPAQPAFVNRPAPAAPNITQPRTQNETARNEGRN